MSRTPKKQIPKKVFPKAVIAILAVIGLAIILAVASVIWHQKDAVERYKDQSHDKKLIDTTNASLDAQASASYAALSPHLAAFGFTLPTPPKSTCGEGDPSLYKYACSTYTSVDTSAHMVTNAQDAAQKLEDFHNYMLASGWKLDGNDFRSQTPQSSVNDWADAISRYGAVVAYDKGNCYVQFTILSPTQTDTGGGASLSCGDSLLPGFYY